MEHIKLTCYPRQPHGTLKQLQEKAKLRKVIDGTNTPKMTSKSRYKYLKSSHYHGLKDLASASSVYFGLRMLQ